MKKILAAVLSLCLCALMLTGCAKPAKQSVKTPSDIPQQQSQSDEISEKQLPSRPRDGDIRYFMPPIPGVRKLFRRLPCGEYSAEYVHTPYGEPKDDTLSYSLTLNDDGTYSMTAVKQGVSAEHSGRYYLRDGGIMLFYDEEIAPPAHNVYVSDCMYGDILAGHKIMIYDGCNTIVLSYSPSEQPVEPEPTLYYAER